MTHDSEFKNTKKLPPGSRPITAKEWEKITLLKFATAEQEMEQALWGLIGMYCQTGRQQIGAEYVKKRLEWVRGIPEKEAHCHLAMGSIMEQIHDYESAISYYRGALELEPTNNQTWYFIHNNLGYCLNHFGRHKEAERYCREAVHIDPQLYNAHKNLGIALEGQGEFAEAARCYVRAAKAEAGDARATKHLENLLAEHPEVIREIPDIALQLKKCRREVERVEQDYQKQLRGE